MGWELEVGTKTSSVFVNVLGVGSWKKLVWKFSLESCVNGNLLLQQHNCITSTQTQLVSNSFCLFLFWFKRLLSSA
jgi:hypothetical protein